MDLCLSGWPVALLLYQLRVTLNYFRKVQRKKRVLGSNFRESLRKATWVLLIISWWAAWWWISWYVCACIGKDKNRQKRLKLWWENKWAKRYVFQETWERDVKWIHAWMFHTIVTELKRRRKSILRWRVYWTVCWTCIWIARYIWNINSKAGPYKKPLGLRQSNRVEWSLVRQLTWAY